MQKQNNRTSKIADIGELNQRIQLMKIETYGRNPNTYQPLERNVVFANVWAKYRNEYLEIKANYSKGVRPPNED